VIDRVELSRLAIKQLRKVPRHVVDKVEEVTKHGY